MSAEIHRMSDYRAAAALPQALTSRPNWLLWRLVQKPGEKKPRKVPFYANGAPRGWPKGRPSDGLATADHPRVEQCTPLDRGALVSYERAVAACIKGHYSGIGFAPMPDDGMIALDFDNCVKDGVVDARIAAVIDGTYSEFSPSGNGIRAFMLGDLASRKDNADAIDRNPDGSRMDGLFDVEFFGTNGFVTITGDFTPDCELFGLEETILELTPAARALYVQRFGETASGSRAVVLAGEADLADLSAEALGWTLEEAREILFACDSNCSRSQWLNALMALHHELGDTPEALDLADEWSSKASNYSGRADVEGRWRSFGRSGMQQLTGRWLLKWRAETRKKQKYDATAEWKTKLQQATDEFQIRERLCPEIAQDERVDDMGREALAQMLREAFARLGNKYQIAQCRKLLIDKRQEKATRSQRNDALPEWLRSWVWVTDDDQFFRMDSDEWLSTQSFNAKYDRYQPRGDSGEIIQPANLAALRDYEIPTVTRGLYVPWADQRFTWEGIDCVNTYRPSSVPEAAPRLTGEDRAAVHVVMEHLRLLLDGREPLVAIMLDWLAHQVQRPGVKVRWAPIIKGIEGDGKTMLGVLLAAVMGSANVRNVTVDVLESKFTDFATGSAVVLLEELKVAGHNRHQVMNKVKPLITNDSIEIHPKGGRSYECMNTTNYLAFTNHRDAAPLSDTDRRWLVAFTPWHSVPGLAAAVAARCPGLSLDAYFERLFDTVKTQQAELRRWLLDHPISDSFKADGRAPMTDEKRVMASLSMSEEECSVREVLELGGIGITREVFLSSYLNNAAMADGLTMQTSAWSALLKKLGYTRVDKKLKWRGKTEIVWVLGERFPAVEELRERLRTTLPEGQSDTESDNDDLF